VEERRRSNETIVRFTDTEKDQKIDLGIHVSGRKFLQLTLRAGRRSGDEKKPERDYGRTRGAEKDHQGDHLINNQKKKEKDALSIQE